jgi:hypothetical protein
MSTGSKITKERSHGPVEEEEKKNEMRSKSRKVKGGDSHGLG